MLKELQEEIEKHDFKDQWSILRQVKRRERDKARAKVNRLFERKNPKIEKICQVCGTKQKIEFHHIDYSKPYVVNILCKYCHTDYHRGIIKIPNAIDLEKLCEEAQRIDPKAMEKISQNDEKRILRILEIYHATGKTKTEQEIESRKNPVEYEYQVYALKWDREVLYERINKRVDLMIEQGLIEEVKMILEKHQKFPTAMQGLGYKEVVAFLEGNMTQEEMIEKIKMETRRYAKRQMTWFRKNKQTIWLEGQVQKQDNIKIILEGLD